MRIEVERLKEFIKSSSPLDEESKPEYWNRSKWSKELNVHLDSSLLLDYEKAKRAFNFMREYRKDSSFFVSRSFYKFLLKYGKSNKWYEHAKFFDHKRETHPKEILELMNEHREYLSFFEIPERIFQKKYAYFYKKKLYEEVGDRKLIEVLFEEWVSLQELSWIVAKSKKTFEKFKEAGATVIKISQMAFDKMIIWIDRNKYVEKFARHKHKLEIPSDKIIPIGKKLRGLGKWITHSSIIMKSAYFQDFELGALAGYMIGKGFFVLIDIENIQQEIIHNDSGI